MSIKVQMRETALDVTIGPQLLVTGDSERNYLMLMNVGIADITVGFDSSIVAGRGLILSPGGLGKQGGSYVWNEGVILTNQIWVICADAGGSTIVAHEG